MGEKLPIFDHFMENYEFETKIEKPITIIFRL